MRYIAMLFMILFVMNAYSAPTNEKVYTLRITSTQPNTPITFKGSLNFYTKSGSNISSLDTVTPYEITVSTSFLSTNIYTDATSPKIRLQVIETIDDTQYTRISGAGHELSAHISPDGADINVN